MERDSRIEVGFPFQIDSRGRVHDPSHEQHVREMIELVLFTSPGERVNRPDFGCGLLEKVFAADADTMEASALTLMAQASLQQWLGKVISVRTVEVEPRDSTLFVRVEYQLKRDEEIYVATFEPRGAPWDM